MDLQLKDQVVFITGPAKGMGRAVSLAFAREGASLALVGRDTAAIEPVAVEARAMGVQAIVIGCDVTSEAQTEAAAAQAVTRFGRVDVLVNVAGGSGPIGKTGWETTTDEFNEIVELNMTGCFNTMRAVLPGMIERNRGHVINMGSVAGHYAYQNGTVYCATKAAVKTITEALKQDLLGTPVRITSIDPGMVETEFSVVRYAGDVERAKKVYENMQPMSGDDIAEMIVFAATRPAHININFMVVMSTYQSTPMTVFRGELGKK